MKRYISVIIFVILSDFISFSQNKIQDGIYMSSFVDMQSMIYEFKNDTFIHSSGDYIECGVRGETLKGLYSIKGKKILFKPFPPSYFQKSVVEYRKEDYRYDRYDFEISITELKNDSAVNEFEIELYDSSSVSIPFLIINGSNGKLNFSYGGIQKITKICLKPCYFENVQLNFDSLFHGRHIYNIKLAPMYNRYVDRGQFSFDIIDITSKFINIYFGSEPLLLVKKEFVTDEFMRTGIFTEKIK